MGPRSGDYRQPRSRLRNSTRAKLRASLDELRRLTREEAGDGLDRAQAICSQCRGGDCPCSRIAWNADQRVCPVAERQTRDGGADPSVQVGLTSCGSPSSTRWPTSCCTADGGRS